MSPRGMRRLELAAAHLGLDIPAESVLPFINKLSEAQRDSLRASVDWVEEYEKHE
jgi:hypothetical protein